MIFGVIKSRDFLSVTKLIWWISKYQPLGLASHLSFRISYLITRWIFSAVLLYNFYVFTKQIQFPISWLLTSNKQTKNMENVCDILHPLLVNGSIFFLCSQFNEKPMLLSFVYIAYKIPMVICMCLWYFTVAPYHLIFFIKAPWENASTVKELNPLCPIALAFFNP